MPTDKVTRDDIPKVWVLVCGACGEPLAMGWQPSEGHPKGGYWWPKACESCAEKKVDDE